MLRWVAAVSTALVLALALFGGARAAYAGSAQAAQSVAAGAAAMRAAFPAPDLLFRMSDGVELPARVWRPADGVAPAGVILALHGFTDSRDAFEYPAPGFADAGYTVIAPDQRGFGATADRGVWAGQARMIDDAIELAAQVRAQHPGARLVLLGESMGGAVAMCVAARAPATADAYVVESPAVWGRGQIAPGLRASLWLAGAVAPGWKLMGNEVNLDIAASDNGEALLRLARDPLTLKGATVAMLSGLVDLMTSAQDAASHLPQGTLVLNGRRDQVIPQQAIAAAWAKMPAHVRRAFYLSGFHLLLRDTDRALVERDVLAWLADREVWLPSGADINAASWTADHAWQGDVSLVSPAETLEGTTGRSTWPY